MGSKSSADGELKNLTALLWDIKGKVITVQDDYNPFQKKVLLNGKDRKQTTGTLITKENYFF